MTQREAETITCTDCGAAVLDVRLDDHSHVLVDAMPALVGNIAARFNRRHGWAGYELRPDASAPPAHVLFTEHTCTAQEQAQ